MIQSEIMSPIDEKRDSVSERGSQFDYLLIGVGILLSVVAVGLLTWMLLNRGHRDGQSVEVLFLGNSYTLGNDLPTMVSRLARSGGHRAMVQASAENGWTLQDHLSAGRTEGVIQTKAWDYVVLQEQSVTPTVLDWRNNRMYPAARALDEMVRANNSQLLFYMTWGRRDGLSDVGFDDYEAMQTSLVNGYMGIANELDASVAPVGVAWRTVRRDYPEINLYVSDGSHANVNGSYLAACVFYAAFFRESPEGLSYRAGIPEANALILQRVAAETVLTDLARWHLPAPVVE